MGTEPSNDLNILILGETGVGKSTWINSFANFLKYRTLSKAKNKDLLSLILSEFTVRDQNLNQVTVTTSKNINEAWQNGQSVTQGSRIYTLKFKDSTIRLIDTPGLGDTRGIDQDKKNFENILSTIQGVSVLHGICILLKPNQYRISLMFRFRIKELLTYFHKDAVQNMIFCFTNSRGTFYRPGDTLNLLKEVLEEYQLNIVSRNTVYCFDSEAYRFLAAVKNNPPVKFSRDEKASHNKSCEISVSVTNRLIKYIRSLPPYQVKSTLSLNNMQKTIFKLTRPIVEIKRLIETNKGILEDENRSILATEKEIRNLETELIKHNGSSRVTFEDPRIRRILDSQIHTKQFKENKINENNRVIIELDGELLIIEDFCFKIAYFLRSNAITPYNDEIINYMNHLISEERYNEKEGGDKKVLNELEKHLILYNMFEKENFEIAAKSNSTCADITVEGIDKSLKELQNLKHNGKFIKEVLDSVHLPAENVFQLSMGKASIVDMKETETSDIPKFFKGLASCVF